MISERQALRQVVSYRSAIRISEDNSSNSEWQLAGMLWGLRGTAWTLCHSVL